MKMIDTTRHNKVFSPYVFGNRRVDVIGAGATGSRIALELAKLGVSNLHVWDGDTVASHNIANQVYGISDIGRLKVEALADIITSTTHSGINIHPHFVDGSESMGEIIFLLTDTMESRKLIWERGLKYKPFINLMIETRMGTSSGRVYTINPNLVNHVKAWEETLHSDEESLTSACGTAVSVGATSSALAGIAVWQFIKWFQIENSIEETDKVLENEIIFDLSSARMLSRVF